MSDIETFEELYILPSHGNIRQHEPNPTTKKKTKLKLKEIPREIRKKDARKPLYLTRYE